MEGFRIALELLLVACIRQLNDSYTDLSSRGHSWSMISFSRPFSARRCTAILPLPQLHIVSCDHPATAHHDLVLFDEPVLSLTGESCIDWWILCWLSQIFAPSACGPQSVGGLGHGSKRYTAPMVAFSLRVLTPLQVSEQKPAQAVSFCTDRALLEVLPDASCLDGLSSPRSSIQIAQVAIWSSVTGMRPAISCSPIP